MSDAPERFFVRDIIVVEDGVVCKIRVGNPLLSDPSKCWLEAVSVTAHEAAVAAARAEGMLEAAEFCHWNAVGLNPRHGYIVDPWTEEQGGSHPGHAYAKALRTKAETTP